MSGFGGLKRACDKSLPRQFPTRSSSLRLRCSPILTGHHPLCCSTRITSLNNKIKVGVRNGDDAQVTDGLKEGDRVVTVGAFELNSEDPDVLAKTKVQVQAPSAGDKGDDK